MPDEIKDNGGENVTANNKTAVATEGKASKPQSGKSNGTDTLDKSAKAFVESGASAQDSVKDLNSAPSGDELRSDTAEGDRALALDNLANYADGNSNHNSLGAVNPVTVAQADKPDYNPQRRPSSRANQMSSLAESPQVMAARVDAKKEAPTNAEITEDRRSQAQEQRGKPLTNAESPYMGEE